MNFIDEFKSIIDSNCKLGSSIRLGEVFIKINDENIYIAHHQEDNNVKANSLITLNSLYDIREFVKFDALNKYRSLKTEKNLRKGWKINDSSIESFFNKINTIYPGLVQTGILYLKNNITPVPLKKTLNRQTGMYKKVSLVNNESIRASIEDTCTKNCIRQIVWEYTNSSSNSYINKEIPEVCTEACTILISRLSSNKKI